MSDKQSNLGWAFDEWATGLDELVVKYDSLYVNADEIADTLHRILPPEGSPEYIDQLLLFWKADHHARLMRKRSDSLTRLQALMREARRTIIALVGADDEDEGDEEEGELYDD